MNLHDYKTGEFLRPATVDEIELSRLLVEPNNPNGALIVYIGGAIKLCEIRRAKKPKTKVSFRRFRDNGAVIALFPEIPYDSRGDFCMSYMTVGQHSAADPCLSGVSRPAKQGDTDVLQLRQELASLGYNLEPIKKVSFKMHKARREAARV